MFVIHCIVTQGVRTQCWLPYFQLIETGLFLVVILRRNVVMVRVGCHKNAANLARLPFNCRIKDIYIILYIYTRCFIKFASTLPLLIIMVNFQ